ncbi:hypothetical protein [Mesorhizobium sp. WSM3626]|uniref:hypothetical protein n=1 Tax=Mesorhizobium sp. WSM3626 TaxID=1040987 RepID=UPI000489FA3E|nr:hypothetical protein [Mesorhizobium sp. WSM3626]
MTFNTEIRGMTFFQNDDGKRAFTKLAYADIYVPELHTNIKGVVLSWSADRGYVAMAPFATVQGGQPVIQWLHKGAFATDLKEKLLDMYERMGGKLPAPAKKTRVEAIADAKAGKIERRVFPATFKIGTANGQPIDEVIAEAECEIARMNEHLDPVDDAAGLHAFLGVSPAVSETMDQAGL